MQENNSERSLNLASCAHEPCGKVSVLPDRHRKKQTNKDKHKKTPKFFVLEHQKNKIIYIKSPDHFNFMKCLSLWDKTKQHA